MHNAVKKFIQEVKEEFPYKFRLRKVLEVGSHNINGSPRSFFFLCDYIGVDITKGKGVDRVGEFYHLFPYDKYVGQYRETFDVVISTEMLEHDRNWDESLSLMSNLLNPGGLLIITCAGPERPEHGTVKTSPKDSPDTNDYYDNISREDFKEVLSKEDFSTYVLQYARGENDLQFYGIKK